MLRRPLVFGEEFFVPFGKESMEITRESSPLAAALGNPRYEVLPLGGVYDTVTEHLPTDVTLTVTSSPAKGIEHTLDLTKRLAGRGYEVVPHIAARLVRDTSHLSEILARLDAAGVREIFVVAGDAPEPAGEFEGSLSLLRAMSGLEHSVAGIGVGGYPEGHPFLSAEDAMGDLSEKAGYATYVVTQICFSADTISDWMESIRHHGITLPVYVGIAAPVSNRKLLRVSSKIGLGESARFLKKHGNWLLRMFLPGGYSPDRLLDGLRPAIENPANDIRGFHIYTFNELGGIEAWRKRLIASAGRGKGSDG